MKKIILECLILLFISGLVIFYQHDQIPKKLSWDEVEFTRLALSLNNKSYTPYSRLATGHSTLYFYVLLLSFKLFGVTNFALRFPSAFFGLADGLVFYLILKAVLPKINYFRKNFLNQSLIFLNLPFLVTFLLITSRWYFNFARFSFEVTFLLFLELISSLFLLSHLENGSEIKLGISAFFSGLSFLSYYPGRIFFLLPLGLLLSNYRNKKVKRSILIYLFIFVLTTLPLLTYLATHRDIRLEEQLFLTDKKIAVSQKLSYLLLNLEKIALMFTHLGDLNGRHNYPGKPEFNPVLGAFFLFGFFLTILHLKKPYNKFFFIYFCLSLIPSIFTYPVENPNSLRTFTALVPSVFFIGNGLIYLFQSEKTSKLLFNSVFIGFFLLFSLSSLYEIRTYFLYQKTVFNKAFELNGRIKKILNLRLWEKTQLL